MEKVFTTKSGTNLFVICDGEDIKSFITDGKKEDIYKALQEDMLNPTDFVSHNLGTKLYALTKQYGIIEQ